MFGLRQSPHNWHKTFGVTLLEIDFKSISSKPRVFVSGEDNDCGMRMLYIVHVMVTSGSAEVIGRI